MGVEDRSVTKPRVNHYNNTHPLNYVASDFVLLRYGLGFLHEALVRAIKVSHTAC